MKKNKSRGIEHNLDIALHCAQKSVLSTGQSRVGFHSYLLLLFLEEKPFYLHYSKAGSLPRVFRDVGLYILSSPMYIYQECVRQEEKEEQDYDNSD